MPKATSRPCDELTIRATRSVPACAARKEWVLAAAVLASSISLIDESVVNVALPGIESALHSTLPAMQWILNAYTLCISALLLLGGAAADQFGRRRIFLIGITIFAVASVGCGLAPHIAVLIIARAIQGVGAALLIPCSLALIGAAYNEKERGAAIGIWSGASAVAVGIGPLLGGWLLDHTSWRMIFLINPLLAAPTIWIAIRHVPESRDLDNPEGLDWKGSRAGIRGARLVGLWTHLCLAWRLGPGPGAGRARRRRRPVGPFHSRGAQQPGPDGAARAIPLAQLCRHQSPDAAALWRPGRCLVLPPLSPDPGARLFRYGGGRRLPPLHGRSGAVVALVGRTGGSLRHPGALDRGAGHRRGGLRTAGDRRRSPRVLDIFTPHDRPGDSAWRSPSPR